MTRFTIEARSDPIPVSLACEAGEGRLIVVGSGQSIPDVVVQPFRPEAGEGRLIVVGSGQSIPDVVVQPFRPTMDIFYRSPESLTPEELAEEATIHVPQSLHQIPQGRLAPSTLDGLVLMQHVDPAFPAISPLPALSELLRLEADVNFGILQADNGGMLFVHRAGTEIYAYASAHSLKALLELPQDERESLFPDFHADEVLISGCDLDHLENLDLGPITKARRISIEDFLPICEFKPESTALIEQSPHLYTLAIGAARAYAVIGGWVA